MGVMSVIVSVMLVLCVILGKINYSYFKMDFI